MHKTTAWPLALCMVALIVYASLYPFTDWRNQGVAAWAFMLAPLPRYWTGFDVVSNVLGYAPLGFFWALARLRSSGHTLVGWRVVAGATLFCAALSLAMESLQVFLPARVASNLDWALNVLGGALGALSAWLLERGGVLLRWERFRARWFVREARGALVLLALWPAALLVPPAVPFGLGQVLERLEAALAGALSGTPFLEWLPLRSVELQPLLPATELLCVAMGVLAPCWVGFSVLRQAWQRALFLIALTATGTLASALSAALSYGPHHAWGWLSGPAASGFAVAAVLACLCLGLPRRGCAALALLTLAVGLSVLNQAPTSAYFAQTLQTWEQGRFVRFYGLAQWLGWLWPYAALGYVLVRISARSDA